MAYPTFSETQYIALAAISKAKHMRSIVPISQESCWLYGRNRMDWGKPDPHPTDRYAQGSTGPGTVGHLHRHYWKIANGRLDLPADDHLRSTCGHKNCINPDHWMLKSELQAEERAQKKAEARKKVPQKTIDYLASLGVEVDE